MKSPDTDPSGPGDAFEALVEVMRRLRAPDGCPWDREQTLDTLRTYVIEEAYEVVQAIEDKDMDALREELGDLLMQVVFQAGLTEDQGRFDIADVCRASVKKLVARHPHVFGDHKAKDAQEVLARWEGYKRAEGKGVLDGVPRRLPALLMALRVSEKASRVGFDWPDLSGVLAKLDEEVGELKEALASGDADAIEEEVGDVLFVAANVARLKGLDPEAALRRMIERFRARFSAIEAALSREGREVSGTPLPTLDALWEEAKAASRGDESRRRDPSPDPPSRRRQHGGTP